MSAYSLLRQVRTPHEIYQQVRARILAGAYQPADRLPTEHELAEAFGVSRTAVREALRLLEQAGLVTMRRGPKGGAYVRQPDASDAGEALSLVLSFDPPAAAEMLEARLALEAHTARLAAQRARPEHLARLAATIDAIAAAPVDSARFLAENWVFHLTVAEAAQNRVLGLLMGSLRELMQQPLSAAPPGPEIIAPSLAAHRSIHAAIAARAPDEAERLMVAHLRGLTPRIGESTPRE